MSWAGHLPRSQSVSVFSSIIRSFMLLSFYSCFVAHSLTHTCTAILLLLLLYSDNDDDEYRFCEITSWSARLGCCCCLFTLRRSQRLRLLLLASSRSNFNFRKLRSRTFRRFFHLSSALSIINRIKTRQFWWHIMINGWMLAVGWCVSCKAINN